MAQADPALRSFKPVLTIVGALYVLLASSMLVRGVGVLRDFAVPESALAEPVLQDFFVFFYQLMAAVGVLTILFAHVVHDRGGQRLVAWTFCVLNVLLALRDLVTSDSALGNHLYRGQATLVFVAIDVALAITFAIVAATAQLRRQA